MGFLQMSLVAAVLILAIVVVRSLTIHKLPKKTFLVLWGVALFRLLIPFYISLPIYGFEVTDRVIEFFANGTTPLASPGVGLVPESVPNINGNTWLYGVVPEHEAQALPTQAPISLVMVVWVVGVIGLALFFIITHLRSRKKYMSGLPIENNYINEWIQSLSLKRTVRVRYSDRINTPMTYGIWKPVILFPKTTDWQDETQLRYILTHELTHIRRFDVLTKWLLAAALCVHWFNPLVWVMYILANRDIELACDETVVRYYGETSKSAYVSALIGLEERKGGFAPLYNNFAKNAIKERIEAIMKLKKKSVFGIMLAVLMVSVMTVGVFAVAANARVDEPMYEGRPTGTTPIAGVNNGYVSYDVQDTAQLVGANIGDIINSEGEGAVGIIVSSVEAVVIGEAVATYEATDSYYESIMPLFTANINWNLAPNTYTHGTSRFNLSPGATISTHITWTPASAAGTSVGVFNHNTGTYTWFPLNNNPESGTITINVTGLYSIAIRNNSSHTINTAGSSFTVN